MDTSAKDCLVLFDTSVSGRMDPGWRLGVLAQRTKSVKHGPMLDVECYPVWDTRTAQRARSEAKKETHRRAQERANRKNAKKRLIRLVNANFGEGDLIVCCEYPLDKQPGSDEEARRDVVNYLKRIKYMRAKRGLPEMRYIYITEVTVSEKFGVRYHHHIIMSGGLDRDEVESKWLFKHEGRCNAKRAQPGEKHMAGYACYLTEDKREREMVKDGKNPQMKAMRRSWNPSKNLIDPERLATTADKKVSIRRAQRIAETAEDFQNAKEVFKKLWPEYELLEVEVKRSRWTSGVYISAQLKRTEERSQHGDKDKGGAGGPVRKRGAAMPVPVGGIPAGEVPGAGSDVPHTERRKARKG